jgi:hypothetical protein
LPDPVLTAGSASSDLRGVRRFCVGAEAGLFWFGQYVFVLKNRLFLLADKVN